MANCQFVTPTADQAPEKICGPACPVEPDRHGHTEPHAHRGANHITSDGLPVHTIYADPPTTPPKAYYGFERKGGIRKSGQQPPTGEIQTLMDDPELRPYSNGQVQHTNQSTASHWRKWKSWGRVGQRVNGLLDRRSSVEMEELLSRQSHAQESLPTSPVAGGSILQSGSVPMTPASFVGDQQIPTVHRSLNRVALSSSTNPASLGGSPVLSDRMSMEIRQPVAHSPVVPDLHGMEIQQILTPRSRVKSAQPDARSISRPGTCPSTPVSRNPSLRRIASHNAATRGRSSTSAARPSMRSQSADYPEDYFSLRHVQQRSIHHVRERFAEIEKSRQALQAMELYEAVRPEVFQHIDRIVEFKASIDADNLMLGGRPEEEGIWKEFLAELVAVEKEIAAEDERLKEVDEVRQAQEEKRTKAAEKRKESAIELALTPGRDAVQEQQNSDVNLQSREEAEINWPLVQSTDTTEKANDPKVERKPLNNLKEDEPAATAVPQTRSVSSSPIPRSRLPRASGTLRKPSATPSTNPQPASPGSKPTLSSQNKQRAKPNLQPPKSARQANKANTQLKVKRDKSE